MSGTSLVSLLIENLRGSVTPFNLPFEKGKNITIIYGENGSGKSTVADALDLLGNGKVGSLDTRGLGVTRRYWHSVGKVPADVKVKLETSGGDCIVSLTKNDVAVTNPALRPQVAVLRRSQILQLIEAKPAERYTAIKKFVDVSGVEASEMSLRNLIRVKDIEYNTATTRVSENQAEIERLWTQAGSPGTSAKSWALQEIQRDQSHLDERKASIDRLINLWDQLVAYPEKIDSFTDQLRAAEAAQQKSKNDLDELKDSVASDYLEVLDILKAAQAHFRKHPNPDACPLCESQENVDGLTSEVDRRIESQGLLNKLEEARKALEARNSVVQQARQRLDDLQEAVTEAALALNEYRISGNIPKDVDIPVQPAPAEVADLKSWIAEHQDKRTKWLDASEACISDKKFIDTLRASLEVLDSNLKSARALEMLLPRLKQTLKIVEDERKTFTDKILNDISIRVGELYEKIHPGEGLNKIVLALDAAKRASLEIATEFCGKQDAPPQAYFSDSHLDTLGLCVFLALAERDLPEERILVLDDVLGSVDEPHVDRIIDMIYDVVTSFRHCVITTHYGPWRHKYRWGWLKNGPCQFVELSRWSSLKGISHGKSIPETERLRAFLQETSPDLQAICGKSGVILEAILDFLTQHYECSVPRRAGGNYTLGDLLPAIGSKLLKALRVEHLQQDPSGTAVYVDRMLEPHLSEINRLAQIRNVMGCHFNQLSFDLLDSDAISFGTEVLALADALIDHEVGWPKNGKSGSYWATTGETRRLHPYKKPS